MVACRDLLARSEFRDMTIFVLHDADIDGYNIARTLGEATDRMPDHNIEVIDLGLTVPQAIDARAGDREFHSASELPTDLELDDAARRMVHRRADTGEAGERAKGQYDCTRCELNAFSSDGLAEFIEAGLARHGVTAKLVPPPEVVDRACADGSRRGAHRDGLGRDRGHGRRRRPGAPTDRRPSGSGRCR